ncbi:MAG: hypothetical protein LBS84_13505 [Clostridiales bacterium]|jgi:hypothetical protein|nr:hypothetical protein [Clostridiales bacterium]
MGAFELNSSTLRNEIHNAEGLNPRRLREECIIALKVYDSCRQQDCLTEKQIGPARSAEHVCIGDDHIHEGDIIDPPDNAASVTIDFLKVKKIIIVDKKPNPFKNGFWDIDLKYVFEYRLTFREADGTVIGCIRANSIFNKRLTLFGSIGTDLAFSTDLFKQFGDNTIDSEPFIMAEAKAVALTAELHHRRHHHHHPHFPYPDKEHCDNLPHVPNEVLVTIGLFSIVKLFRIVNLTVESRGFCVPDEGEDISPLNPCEFFDRLDFPLDIFAPPQRPEFLAGISGNIPRDQDGCGCR